MDIGTRVHALCKIKISLVRPEIYLIFLLASKLFFSKIVLFTTLKSSECDVGCHQVNTLLNWLETMDYLASMNFLNTSQPLQSTSNA